MAPPQVDLAKKQPLEDVEGWAEKVGPEKLPGPLPPIGGVPVESKTTVLGRRSVLAKRRCKKLIIGMVIGAVIATLITVGAFMACRRFRKPGHWKGHVKDRRGHHAEEEFRTEGHKQLIHMARNSSHHFFGLLAVLDYGTQLAGFKDCRSQTCYVDRLRESYDEGCERWRHYKEHARLPSERPLRVGPSIPRDVLQYIGGEPIFELCGRLPSYWVIELTQPLPEDDNTTQVIFL